MSVPPKGWELKSCKSCSITYVEINIGYHLRFQWRLLTRHLHLASSAGSDNLINGSWIQEQESEDRWPSRSPISFMAYPLEILIVVFSTFYSSRQLQRPIQFQQEVKQSLQIRKQGSSKVLKENVESKILLSIFFENATL